MKLTSEQVKKVAKKEFQLKLKGKTAVFIDWANVYGWEKSFYDPGHIGREIWRIKRGLFKVSIENMGL